MWKVFWQMKELGKAWLIQLGLELGQQSSAIRVQLGTWSQGQQSSGVRFVKGDKMTRLINAGFLMTLIFRVYLFAR